MAIPDLATRFSLRKSFFLALGLPVLMVLVVSTSLIAELWTEVRTTRALSRNMELISALSGVVHEQQKERGASSVFLNSAGRQFGPELASQREETRVALNRLSRALGGFEAAVLIETEQQEGYARILSALSRRSGLLNEVDRQTISPKEAIGYYTALNADMIELVGDLGSLAQNHEIATEALAYKAFMIAKERAGIERAVGAGAFASEAFPLPTLLRLQELISEQDLSLQSFRRLARADQKAALARAEGAEASQKFLDLRALAFAVPETGDLKGVSGPDFFRAATERIELLREVETLIVDDLATLALRHERAAMLGLVALGGAVLIAGAGAILFGLVLLRAILRSIGALVAAASEMEGGNLQAEVPTRAAPELLRIAEALDRFRGSILEARLADQQVQEEQSRQEAARQAERSAQLQAEVERAEEEARASRALRKQEQAYAHEIAEVVTACAHGDFSRRIDLAGKEGIFGDICRGMNRIGESANAGLHTIHEGLRRLAEGDLAFDMGTAQEGVFREIAGALEETRDSMRETLERVLHSAASVETSTSEIASAARDLASRTERNAAMLERTTLSLGDMSTGIERTAVLAGTAREAALEIQNSADLGHDVVRQSIEAMEEIRVSSRQIGQVLKVIDDIAFQTNLLALNAGVEAARAGEAGRGFTVVASEVRSLAQRSSEAAREVAEMVGISGSKVEHGVAMVNRSGAALNEIVARVHTVTEQIAQIAATSAESESSINEIRRVTVELDKSTQHNAAMFEETTAAVSSLELEARSLARQAGSFRLSVEEDKRDTAPSEATGRTQAA